MLRAFTQPFGAVRAPHQRAHRAYDLGVLDLNGAPHPALGGIVEFDRVPVHGHVAAQQGGHSIGFVLLGVLLPAGSEVAAIKQAQRESKHPLTG